MTAKHKAEMAMERGRGILRLAPTWVPRYFCRPGRRIKLHPDDYYAMGMNRGGIDERWLASTTPADNGPLTSPNEGLSYVIVGEGQQDDRILLRDAVEELKGDLIGDRSWKEFQCWPMYSKFFDNEGPLGFHIHHDDAHAKLVNQLAKPEAYYFPPQLNNHGGEFPYTFFGFKSGVTKDEVRRCLQDFTKGDNRITALSQCYRLEVGTGWDVPPGTLHAPGSLCTYEPQFASDVYAFYESLVHDQITTEELLWKDTPEDRKGDVDYLLEVIDWDLNMDPEFATHRFMRPMPVKPAPAMMDEGYIEQWICYKSDSLSAKELTVMPGREVTIKDAAAYGMILMQGHGAMGVWDIETPSLIRYGDLTLDEFFVSESAAREGVKIVNKSPCEPLVMLKHFAAGNPDLKEISFSD